MADEFEEEEVWAVMKERVVLEGRPKTKCITSSTNKSLASSSSVTSSRRVYQQSSAPVNIPDWSKNSGAKKDEDEGEDEDCKVPPHEWIAKKLARSQISSFSVCEGVGRTLKGRDLSKVRNAVLTRTGFLE
ncbi:uncharacterized protein LOC120277334 [Dioscorea cayenensis subsp. rotundata]|uniref:Uncharacterized protein LOC120277334 n=1 Tax=Dioscorea cayennensis subsp. rotundata TaxID=55577 RepID=A0AB40CJ62_DIOCR|nr:uncharacterized protein LOC120277334 [Dioscorea cayenensis subsp. rotundata]XP_039140066.1 uncharacterized protein LOC120277334 [Dioscorea cayenensis subsp. rotundata]